MVFQVAAIAVVRRGGKPLYTEVYGFGPNRDLTSDTVLAVEFLMYASLDVCEEFVTSLGQEQQSSKSSAPTTSANGSPSSQQALGAKKFFGDLLQDRSFETWGYQTTAGVRYVLATSGASPKEKTDRDAVEQLLRSVNHLVSKALANPFRELDEPLTSSVRFITELQRTLGVVQG
jgi:hypothetical protein